jgi:L-alanine-DL-glutamate epimerase-like enolase superfamily enzyme
MKIVKAECIALNIPFYSKRVTRAMHRAQTHDERVSVVRLEADNGLVGWGDCHGGPFAVEALVGQNPAALIHREDLGQARFMALLDLVGKYNDVPAHALLGCQVRRRCPVSWWDIDMPARDWIAEAKESLKRGYTTFKMKARPWRDIVAQTTAVSKVVPADYKFDIDFNGFLLNQARAEMMLHVLDENPSVGMYESPFYLHRDLDGARLLRQRVRKPIVEHFNERYLENDCSDGFVIGDRHSGVLAATHNKVFWLQLVGAGLTAAYTAHLGSVLTHAQLPHITCHELWEHDLLEKRLAVKDGYIDVPEGPGLGVEPNLAALEKYRVDAAELTPKQRYRAQKRILRIHWPVGPRQRRQWEFTDEGIYQTAFYAGNLPGFEKGVDLEVIEDDKSAAFKKRHARLVEQGL